MNPHNSTDGRLILTMRHHIVATPRHVPRAVGECNGRDVDVILEDFATVVHEEHGAFSLRHLLHRREANTLCCVLSFGISHDCCTFAPEVERVYGSLRKAVGRLPASVKC